MKLKPKIREFLSNETHSMLSHGRRLRHKRDVTVLKPKKIHDYNLWTWYKRMLREQEKLDRWHEDIRLVRQANSAQRKWLEN